MTDFLMVAIPVVFVAACLGSVALCARLIETSDDRAER
jgi:hypothetical protein